ncbi:uncharacterized protein LOC136084685 isoform X2 [Hydra vulgaris]|uniref:Uncharacterized protein LOC136084685 isoform X2 n=1 Tax=Hydra vulgaris TaxID=6087 RepID=A0ABM4CHT5_HYDVU
MCSVMLKNLNTQELINHLISKRISVETTAKLSSEDIDGDAFLQMNSVLFHCIGIKMGHAIKLQSLIAAQKEQSTDYAQTDYSQTDFTIANNHVSLNQTSYISNSNPFSDSTYSCDSDVLHTPVLRIDNIKFDVHKLLDEHQTGKLVIVEYDTTGMLLKYRFEMVHILVNIMVNKVGNLYPSRATKTNLAMSIINAFPKLHSGGPLGYENYYCAYKEVEVNGKKKKITPHGHIKERLKTIRKFDGVHAQATRKRKSISPTTFDVAVPFSNEERNIMSELSFDDIQYDRKQFILEKTRISRRNWIMSSKPPFHEFIRKFPPFKDLGFDFQREFTATFENAQDLLMQWENMAPHVITWARRKANPMAKQLLLELDSQLISSSDRNMEFAFHLLPYILQVSPRNKHRPSTAEVAAHFIQIFPKWHVECGRPFTETILRYRY